MSKRSYCYKCLFDKVHPFHDDGTYNQGFQGLPQIDEHLDDIDYYDGEWRNDE